MNTNVDSDSRNVVKIAEKGVFNFVLNTRYPKDVMIPARTAKLRLEYETLISQIIKRLKTKLNHPPLKVINNKTIESGNSGKRSA